MSGPGSLVCTAMRTRTPHGRVFRTCRREFSSNNVRGAFWHAEGFSPVPGMSPKIFRGGDLAHSGMADFLWGSP